LFIVLTEKKALTKHVILYNVEFTTNFTLQYIIQCKQQGHPGKGGRFLTNDLNYERPSRCKDILWLYRHWLNIVNITPIRDNKTTRNYLYGFKQA
jgi:hypothetical protein